MPIRLTGQQTWFYKAAIQRKASLTAAAATTAVLDRTAYPYPTNSLNTRLGTKIDLDLDLDLETYLSLDIDVNTLLGIDTKLAVGGKLGIDLYKELDLGVDRILKDIARFEKEGPAKPKYTA